MSGWPSKATTAIACALRLIHIAAIHCWMRFAHTA
jgi:hypothetical protein